MFSWSNPPCRPFIVAHRGSSALAPENTIASFSQAISDGAHAVELDVQLTRDRKLVVFHDTTLSRTSDGRGRLREKTFAQLRALSAGGWFHESFHMEKIPALDEVLELANGRIGVNIEVKGGKNVTDDAPVMVREILASLRRHRMKSSILISSFQHRYLRYCHYSHPGITIGCLINPLRSISRTFPPLVREGLASYLVLDGASCGRNLVRRAHNANLLVGEYTVNSTRRLRRALRNEVDAIYTDSPGEIVEYLRKNG